MALDGIFLYHIAQELRKTAVGGRVSQIYQPNKDEIIIALRTLEGTKKLLLCASANSARIHFISGSPENPQTPPMLCMLLRKKLGTGKLVNVRQNGLDRIIFLDFEATNELGDRVNITISVEIMGKYSNVIIIGENDLIVDSLKRVDITMSSQRLVLPNLKYELPPQQDKLNVLLTSADEIVERILSFSPACPLNKAILNSLQGISPVICRELEYKLGENVMNNELSAVQKEKFTQIITDFCENIKKADGTPTVLFKSQGKPFELSFMPIEQYADTAITKTYESFSLAADAFYNERSNSERMGVKAHDLQKLLSNLTERLSRKINTQQAELKTCKNREQLRIYGDLLQANLYRIERGCTAVTVENFYDENYAPVTIALNPAISPAANAQKFYKDYQKAKNGEQMLTVQLEKAKSDLDYILSVTDALSRAKCERELSQIKLELTEQGYIKRPKGKQKPPAALPPLEFTSSDGFKILVGRNNIQNDKLTLKQAAKTDIWLHTKDIHGSHTIIIAENKEVPQSTLYEAACLAAFHSKAKGADNVAVDYTQVRNVSKPSGAKPGMVIYVKNKTLYVPAELPTT